MVIANITDYGFDIKGHADYDDNGYDIVCSAISALSQSVAIELQKHCKAKVRSTNGWIAVDIEEPTELSIRLIGVLVTGFYNIANDYPKHLQYRVKKGLYK